MRCEACVAAGVVVVVVERSGCRYAAADRHSQASQGQFSQPASQQQMERVRGLESGSSSPERAGTGTGTLWLDLSSEGVWRGAATMMDRPPQIARHASR